MVCRSRELIDPSDEAIPFSSEEKERLLNLARATIGFYFEHRRRATPDDLNIACTAGMRVIAGAFVTLHLDGQLRGCIGELDPDRSLCDVVIDHALNAAFKDPRFPPLTQEEWKRIHVEISVLSPPRPVESWRDIEIGVHGVILRHGRASAVFLPQVATEQGWDRKTMLDHLALKAGLPAGAWRDEGAQFSVFMATVFGEEQS